MRAQRSPARAGAVEDAARGERVVSPQLAAERLAEQRLRERAAAG
ncbi:hypothetical protein [Sorangium sp. So ce1000]